MHRLLFLSSISVLSVAGLAGCSDDTCGPGDAPDNGLVAGDQDQKLTFGGLRSSANHDCPDAEKPELSVSIMGSQTDGQGLLTLCIPRPDKLQDGLPLGTGVQIIDLRGQFNGCDYAIETARPVQGTVSGKGVCDNGTNNAGYALVFDGHISLHRTCPTATDTIAVNLSGSVAVAPN
jgi:hypothetical protein